MKRYFIAVAALFLLVPSVTAGGSGKFPGHRPPRPVCPVMMRGADVKVENISGGVKITVTSDNADRAGIIWRAAQRHVDFVEKIKNGVSPEVSTAAVSGAEPAGKRNAGETDAAAVRPKPPFCPCLIDGAAVKAEKTDNGAVLFITGQDEKTAALIRRAAAEEAEKALKKKSSAEEKLAPPVDNVKEEPVNSPAGKTYGR